ncbi:hypothetical protein GQ55_9G358300 [Panicum hallii var. hallii]|uniref:Uncharacterized protein n=1 Tax=Panicum hallii var. hallii TaxID=1504633 RepID=A0A2T7C8Q3_9POAL|nr:hypothetical protein GQ55_9G358300 [Panicum hallii var. hallii]
MSRRAWASFSVHLLFGFFLPRAAAFPSPLPPTSSTRPSLSLPSTSGRRAARSRRAGVAAARG